MSRPVRAGLVLTGGTVGSRRRRGGTGTVVSLVPAGGPVPPGLRLVRSALPRRWAYTFETVAPLALASEDMRPGDWRTLAATVRRLAAAGLDRVLVLHGTDTMGFTAAALSFLLRDTDVTVVLTGANLPPDQRGSDARRNIHDALVALAGLPPGTFVAFTGGADLPGLVHLGTQVRKVGTHGQPYQSVNRPPVAQVQDDALSIVDPTVTVRPPCPVPDPLTAPDPGVLSFRLYPGLDLDAMRAAVEAGEARAVVVELYAAVTGPTVAGSRSLPAFIEKCRAGDVCVFLTVSAPATNHANVYDSYLALRDAGGVYLPGMIPETAIVKCMWALGRTRDPAALVRLMRTPVAGEFGDTAPWPGVPAISAVGRGAAWTEERQRRGKGAPGAPHGANRECQ